MTLASSSTVPRWQPPRAPAPAASSNNSHCEPQAQPQPAAEESEADKEIVRRVAALSLGRDGARYTLGICVLDRKARSDPMLEILSRLPKSLVSIKFFGDRTILEDPVEEWPVCDALVSFFSKGFPLNKAREYVALRHPVVVNDLDTQHWLQDRREVYRVLEERGVPTPRHVIVSRDGYGDAPEPEVIESEDYLEVNGERISKPFVEKPVDGDDHNINIYYPMSAGGGCKKLFRKIGNRSSEFDPKINQVRRNGSFIYEEFLSTQGTDVKVYTVGPNYAHAEARKSPVLDGRVVRDQDGKEVRYPVMLSPSEKEIARQVCRAFRQSVCGFDILRVRGAAYVCDVNGWSFVKNSDKYYDDCAVLLSTFLEGALSGQNTATGKVLGADDFSAFGSLTLRFASEDPHAELAEPPMAARGSTLHSSSSSLSLTDGADNFQEEELRCVLAVIRHGDRTPKQKMKMHVCHPLFLEYYKARVGSGKKKSKDLKIKAVSDLEKLLEVSKQLLAKHDARDPEFMEFLSEREEGFGEDASDRVQGYRTLRDVLQRWRLVGINRKVQLKPKETVTAEDGTQVVVKLLLIIKWGGDLTHMGEEQAELLGQKFRRMMYPGGEGGLNRLHSTYRHDLKIYTSDEGRVQKTAASFAKGLLELEGDLIPILVGLVLKSKDADSMLDQSGSSAQEIIMKVKQRLHKIIHRDDHCSQLMDSESRLTRSVALALQQVDQPIKKMAIMHQLLKSLKEQLTRTIHEKAQLRAELSKRQAQTAQTDLRANLPTVERSLSVSSMTTSHPRRRHKHALSQEEEEERAKRRQQRVGGRGGGIDAEVEFKYPEPCGRESLEVMRERWAKLYRDFFIKKTDTYDLSKIPDIHDCIRYDALHNSHLNLRSVRELLDIAASLAHALVPQEYGINVDEKVAIGSAMCRTLLMKIKDDLDLARGLELHSTHRLNPSYVQSKHRVKSTHRAVRTRLYFTSESHLHTLLNVLRYGRADCPVPSPVGDEAKKWIEGIPEFCYMTHFVVRVFERFQFAKTDPQRFRLEVSLSPGADQDPLTFDMDKQLEVSPLKIISREDLTCQEVVDYLADTIAFAERKELSSKASGGESPEAASPAPSPPLKRSEYFTSNASSTSSTDE